MAQGGCLTVVSFRFGFALWMLINQISSLDTETPDLSSEQDFPQQIGSSADVWIASSPPTSGPWSGAVSGFWFTLFIYMPKSTHFNNTLPHLILFHPLSPLHPFSYFAVNLLKLQSNYVQSHSLILYCSFVRSIRWREIPAWSIFCKGMTRCFMKQKCKGTRISTQIIRTNLN